MKYLSLLWYEIRKKMLRFTEPWLSLNATIPLKSRNLSLSQESK